MCGWMTKVKCPLSHQVQTSIPPSPVRWQSRNDFFLKSTQNYILQVITRKIFQQWNIFFLSYSFICIVKILYFKSVVLKDLLYHANVTTRCTTFYPQYSITITKVKCNRCTTTLPLNLLDQKRCLIESSHVSLKNLYHIC